VLTILTVPKPFTGHIGDIQSNALASWIGLRQDVQVVLLGDEPGVAEAAREVGVDHVGGIEKSPRGTPRLDSAFALAGTVARSPLWCLINADIVLLEDFLPTIEGVTASFEKFLMIGECRDLAVIGRRGLHDPVVREQLRVQALEEGRLRGCAALDYFVFPRGLFDPLPPFLIGRACFDNWLVWRARDREHAVVDATRSVVAIHQSHDYVHVDGGKQEVYYGEEAQYNMRLAGVRSSPTVPAPADTLYSLDDASHRLDSNGRPSRYWWSIWRIRARARFAKWLIDLKVVIPLLESIFVMRKRLGLLDLRKRWFGGRFARS
jgi:hypothetical protein